MCRIRQCFEFTDQSRFVTLIRTPLYERSNFFGSIEEHKMLFGNISIHAEIDLVHAN